MDAECKQYLHIDSCVIVSGGPWSGINTASWSPDGSRLAYWTAFPSNVYVLDVATGESTLVGKEGAWPSWLDNNTLFVEM
jgi:Tol biopolymer transport system component